MTVEIIPLIIGIAILLFLIQLIRFMGKAIINFVLGVVLILISNALGITMIKMNVVNLLVCAALGVPGSLILIALNLLGIY